MRCGAKQTSSNENYARSEHAPRSRAARSPSRSGVRERARRTPARTRRACAPARLPPRQLPRQQQEVRPRKQCAHPSAAPRQRSRTPDTRAWAPLPPQHTQRPRALQQAPPGAHAAPSPSARLRDTHVSTRGQRIARTTPRARCAHARGAHPQQQATLFASAPPHQATLASATSTRRHRGRNPGTRTLRTRRRVRAAATPRRWHPAKRAHRQVTR